MFRMLNAAMALMPLAEAPCYNTFQIMNCGGGHYFTFGPGCVGITHVTHVTEAAACQMATAPIQPGSPGDPVEQLQALRRQLEIALAGVQAQERVALEHREAARKEAEKK
jgi:hypothetical protein